MNDASGNADNILFLNLDDKDMFICDNSSSCIIICTFLYIQIYFGLKVY